MTTKYGCIYKITSPSGKSYIGQTVIPIHQRISQHAKRPNSILIYNAIKKYGLENMEWETLESNIPEPNLNKQETYYIKRYNSIYPNGYNLKEGGSQTRHNEKSKAKLSKANSGPNNPMYGKTGEKSPVFGRKHSKETKEKIGAAHKGKIISEETRQKMSKGSKGKKHTQETIKKMSRARKGKGPSYQTRIKISNTLKNKRKPKKSSDLQLYLFKGGN